MATDLLGAMSIYEAAARYVYDAGYDEEVEWQRNLAFSDFSESELLRETAWVVLCSGFREQRVRRLFDYVSLCFCDWESADAIVDAETECRDAAKTVFNNERKLAAIGSAARRVAEVGFSELRKAIHQDPIGQLRQFPYIGGATAWHLAKNLGMDVAKPDRHLARVASSLGFCDAGDLCAAIAREAGERVCVVDVIVWRYFANSPEARARRQGR